MGFGRRYGTVTAPTVNPLHAVITAITAVVTAVTAYATWSRKAPTDPTGYRR